MDEERTRVREPEPGEQNRHEIDMNRRNAYVQRQFTSKLVIHEEDREWELGRQGLVRHILYTTLTPDAVLEDMKVFVQDVRRHSGKHKHQGGVCIYVLEGRGWTVVNGERIDWKAGDMMVLPYKPGGIEHQHFNADPDKGCKWLAVNYYPFQRHVPVVKVQLEEAVVE